MKFSDAYNNLPPDKQTILDNALLHWETTVHNESRIVNNLRNESLLSQTDWDTKFKYLFSAIQSFGASYPHRWREIKKNLRPNFYNSLLLKGGVCNNSNIVTIGTVIPRNKFENYLFEFQTHFREAEDIDRFLRDLNTYQYIPKGTEHYSIKNQEYLLWMTWDEKNPESPFNFLQTETSEELRIALGLGHSKYREGQLLAFNFTFKTNNPSTASRLLFNPTFCDSDFCPFFKPGGLTRPLNNGFFLHDDRVYEIDGRPEVVSKSAYHSFGYLLQIKVFI